MAVIGVWHMSKGSGEERRGQVQGLRVGELQTPLHFLRLWAAKGGGMGCRLVVGGDAVGWRRDGGREGEALAQIDVGADHFEVVQARGLVSTALAAQLQLEAVDESIKIVGWCGLDEILKLGNETDG